MSYFEFVYIKRSPNYSRLSNLSTQQHHRPAATLDASVVSDVCLSSKRSARHTRDVAWRDLTPSLSRIVRLQQLSTLLTLCIAIVISLTCCSVVYGYNCSCYRAQCPDNIKNCTFGIVVDQCGCCLVRTLLLIIRKCLYK